MTNKEARKKMWLEINERLKGVKKIKRNAKVGEWILIIKPMYTFGFYKEGDILKVTHIWCDHAGLTFNCEDLFVYESEYVVLENYIPEEPVTIVEHLVKDRKTIVKLSNGKVGVAICSPEDEFDIYEGLRLATERAYGKVEGYKKPNPVKEVKRKAKVGEYIKIVRPILAVGLYKEGDILKVSDAKKRDKVYCDGILIGGVSYCIYDTEYVVLENYKPTK